MGKRGKKEELYANSLSKFSTLFEARSFAEGHFLLRGERRSSQQVLEVVAVPVA